MISFAHARAVFTTSDLGTTWLTLLPVRTREGFECGEGTHKPKREAASCAEMFLPSSNISAAS